MTVTRRFVDAVFIEPKNRFYVILHKGKFWRLPRMQLTNNAWLLKKPYVGSHDDIFMVKDQRIHDSVLAKTLHTHQFPPQLANISATRFLQWWSSKDYLWVNQEKKLVNSTGSAHNDKSTPAMATRPDETGLTLQLVSPDQHFNTQPLPNKEVANGLISDSSSGGYAPEPSVFDLMLADLGKSLS